MSGWEEASGRLGPGAAWYASQGWKVFPVWGIVNGRCGCGKSHPAPKDNGKHPHGRLVPSGQKSASSDPEVVAEWWESDPEANVGMQCSGSGFVVIDVDPRNGGLETWPLIEAEILADGGEIPETVEALTGEYTVRGGGMARGRHLIFRVDAAEKFHDAFPGYKGVDVKHRGYVLVAPSRHFSGVTYEWAPGKAPWEIEIADAPEEMLSMIRKGRRAGSGGAGGGGGGNDGGFGLGVVEWDGEKVDVDKLIEDGIREGERAVTLYRIACAVANQFPVRTDMGRAAVMSIMKGINAHHTFPPLDWDEELAGQVENAIEFVRENPRVSYAERAMGISSDDMQQYAQNLAGGGGSAESTGSVDPEETRGGVTAAVELTSAHSWSEVTDAERVTDQLGFEDDVVGLMDPDAISDEGGGRIGERSLSDIGNGRRIIDKAGRGMRYTPGIGWFVWNGAYWVPDSDGGRVREIAKRLPVWIADEVRNFPEGDKRRDDLLQWAFKTKSLKLRKNAVEDAAADARIRVGAKTWDSNAELLGVRNGVINLRTGDLLPSDPSLYITKQSRVAYSPGMTNPRWAEYLRFATGGDVELQRYLQLAAGYTLTGLRDHEVLFLVYGPSGSGKSTLLEVLGTLLGDYYVPMDSDVLVEQQGVKSSTEYHMAELMGKRMIGISEWPESKATKEEAVKRLTGDLTISARHPGQRPFQFESQAKLWIGTNSKPRISDQAMWRRIRAINFNHVPERPDPSLKPYLLEPNGGLPAVLSWAVDGAVMLLGSTDREPLRPSASRHVLEATDEYRKSEDRTALFLSEETQENVGASIPVKELFIQYRTWCEDRGERPQTMIAFMRRLEEKGLPMTGSGTRAILQDRVLRPRVVPQTGTEDWGQLVSGTSWGN